VREFRTTAGAKILALTIADLDPASPAQLAERQSRSISPPLTCR